MQICNTVVSGLGEGNGSARGEIEGGVWTDGRGLGAGLGEETTSSFVISIFVGVDGPPVDISQVDADCALTGSN